MRGYITGRAAWEREKSASYTPIIQVLLNPPRGKEQANFESPLGWFRGSRPRVILGPTRHSELGNFSAFSASLRTKHIHLVYTCLWYDHF